MVYSFGSVSIDLSARPVIMGVLNVTPDSFSDGGKYLAIDSAIRRADEMIAEGADMLDIGGESTRPGAAEVSVEEEIRRTEPVIHAISERHPSIPLSIDTMKSAVALRALDAGAVIVNDVSGGTADPVLFSLCGARKATMVLMHMQGTPRTMQQQPQYHDVVREVRAFLDRQAAAAREAGVTQIMLDVGIGFGKTLEHNIALLRHLAEFHETGYPLLLGVSRKSLIGTIIGGAPPEERIFGTAGAVAAGVIAGAQVHRVHDVKAMRDVALVASRIRP